MSTTTREARRARGLYWDAAWRLVDGCTPVSPGCDGCWAAQESRCRQHHPNALIRAQYGPVTGDDGRFTGAIRLLEGNLDRPLATQAPTVFSIWNDLFHADVPHWFVDAALWVIRATPQHTFLALTKRPEMIASKLYGLPDDGIRVLHGHDALPNLWIGVTVESAAYLPRVAQLTAAYPGPKWLSLEPLLGPVDLAYALFDGGEQFGVLPGMDWVVCGGETGPGARPLHPDWARAVRDDCQRAGVPFYFKQWGEWYDADGDCAAQYPNAPLLHVDDLWMRRVGRRAAGRRLDGRTWDAQPEGMR